MSILSGEITYQNTGLYPASLGVLSSLVSIDRAATIVGPVPVASGDPGQFTLDITSLGGSYVSAVVSSSIPGTTKATFAEWNTRPSIVWAVSPLDLQDCKDAKICSYTGLWVPAHALAMFEGRYYWDRVCPTRKPGVDDMAPPPGILVVATGDGTDHL